MVTTLVLFFATLPPMLQVTGVLHVVPILSSFVLSVLTFLTFSLFRHFAEKVKKKFDTKKFQSILSPRFLWRWDCLVCKMSKCFLGRCLSRQMGSLTSEGSFSMVLVNS